MNILVVSSMAWDDTNSIGNTLSNWFGGETWQNDNFYNLYLRKQVPNNNICNDYYQISVFDIINPFVKRRNIGKYFKYNHKSEYDEFTNQKREKQLIGLLHKLPLSALYALIDSSYRRKSWLNNSFIQFINNSKIDVVFACVTDVAFLAPFLTYVKENTNAKIVLYIHDDMRGRFETYSILRKNRLFSELKIVIENSDLNFCASEMLAKHYFNIYGKKMYEIYKGCTCELSINNQVGSPLKIIYAGNLFYGRNNIVHALIESIKKYNERYPNSFFLEIYCGDDMLESDKEKYNVDGISKFLGKCSYENVCKKIKMCDFVLIPESFDETDKILTKYSFSTKIPEALQSGANILAIGPKDVSSMEFLSRLPFVYYADDIEKIDNVLNEITGEIEMLKSKREAAVEFAREKFDITVNRERIRDSILQSKE